MSGKSLIRLILVLVSVSGASHAQAFVTTGSKWGSSVFGTGATVTWSLMSNGVACDPHCGNDSPRVFTSLADFMPTDFKNAIESAFDAWSAVADLTFIEVPDDGSAFGTSGAMGDIRIGGHTFDGVSGTLAHVFSPGVFNEAGDVHFDIAEIWETGFGGPGFDIFQVMAHEIGHAIGLSHTSVAASLLNPFYTEAFAGLQADDIAGARFLYGDAPIVAAPVPPAIWMMLSGLLLLWSRKRKQVVMS